MPQKNLTSQPHATPGVRGLERILEMDRLIRDHQYPNPRSIAERFEVSIRTVYDDLRHLRDQLGAPVQFDKKQGGWFYTDPSSFALPAIFLSEGDMLAVFIGIEVAGRYAGTPYESMLKKSLDKIARALPDTVSLQLDQFASFATPPSLTVDEEKLNQLYDAVRRCQPVRMTYFTASSGKTAERQVDPYHLHHYNGEWYLIALDSKRREIRVFNVGRIKKLYPVANTVFRRPAHFNAGEWLQNSFGIECDGKVHQVRIRFDAAQARYIRERTWHRQQCITDAEDGSLVLQFPAAGLGEVLRWVMKYGSHAQVLQPALLRKMVQTEVAAMDKLYAAAGNNAPAGRKENDAPIP